jgi:hypothetical protein
MLGSWFAERVTRADGLVAIASTTVLAIALGLIGGPVVVIAADRHAPRRVCRRRDRPLRCRGGLDGDGMGALIELSSSSRA